MGSIIRDSLEDAQSLVISSLDMLSPELHEINKAIHSHPETCYQEFFAHDTITAYLEKKGFKVRRQTYGLDTSFEAQVGEGGRQVVFCTEYDALPSIGHACGHNLIATASIGAFLATCHAFKELKISGRVRILGTPAEEGGGGKAKLIDAGAFNPPEDVAAAIMAHPASSKGNLGGGGDNEGLAGMKLIAAHKFKVEFEGKPAHAAAEPWNGVNALDASVATYNNIAMLRQQIRPDERIHAIIEQGGLSQNVIADYARMSFNVRAPTIKRADALLARVKHCIEGGGLAAGCKLTWTWLPTSMNLRANHTLCQTYVNDMASMGVKIALDTPEPIPGSTDMGNVSHYVPSFHGGFTIPDSSDTVIHNPNFTAVAGSDKGHAAAIKCAKGMAMLALRVLTDENIANKAREDFGKLDVEDL